MTHNAVVVVVVVSTSGSRERRTRDAGHRRDCLFLFLLRYRLGDGGGGGNAKSRGNRTGSAWRSGMDGGGGCLALLVVVTVSGKITFGGRAIYLHEPRHMPTLFR
jgi:hypothetical protein